MGALIRYVDSLYGDDTNYDGTTDKNHIGSGHGPWKTLGKAGTTNPGGGNWFVVYVANNGYVKVGGVDPVYRTASTAPVLGPRYAGQDTNNNFEWYFNGAPVSANKRIEYDAYTWTLVEGFSNVYKTTLAATPTRFFVGGPNHWYIEGKLPLQCFNVGRVPVDSDHLCWWYDSANTVLYYCDMYGNPNTQTGLFFETQTSGQCGTNAIYLDTAYTNNYHRFFDGYFVGGSDYTVSFKNLGSMFRCVLHGGYNGLIRCAADGHKLYYNKFLNASMHSQYGNIVLAGTSRNCQLYNNLIYGDSNGVTLSDGSGSSGGPHLAKNNLFLDLNTAWKIDSANTGLTEDYNAYGLRGGAANDYRSLSTMAISSGQTLTTGAHSLPAGTSGNITQVLHVSGIETGLFRLQLGFTVNLHDKGVALSLPAALAKDMAGVPVGSGTPDIGPYEYYANTRRSIVLGLGIEL